MRPHPMHRRAIALLLAAVLPACYSYVPLEDTPPRPGDEVRVRLAREPAGSPSQVEAEDDDLLQGVVVRSGPDSLSLWRRPTLESGRRMDVFRRDTTAVAISAVQRIERSELDAVKTGGLVVAGLGVIAGFALLVSNVESGGDGGVDGGNGGGTLDLRIPLP